VGGAVVISGVLYGTLARSNRNQSTTVRPER